MFNLRKSREKHHASLPVCTCLAEGTHCQGELQAGIEGLCIEGSLEGTILCEGQVVVAPTGYVKGTIQARQLTVRGRVEGVLKVAECLEILGAGWVEGEVELATLVVDEGGTLQGTCLHRSARQEKEPVPLVPRQEDPALARYGQPGGMPQRPTQEYLHSVRGFDRRRG